MADPKNMNAAKSTYAAFIDTLKWTVPLLAVITLVVVVLIS